MYGGNLKTAEVKKTATHGKIGQESFISAATPRPSEQIFLVETEHENAKVHFFLRFWYFAKLEENREEDESRLLPSNTAVAVFD